MTVFEVKSVADQVYAVVRERIASGRVERGARLHQEDLAAELGVSRTPVREALRRLAAEGLVDLLANRGARVATSTVEEIRAAYESRLVVEPGAARLAAERHADVAPLRAAIAKQDGVEPASQRYFEANREFHLALVAACGNQQLLQFMEQTWIGRIGAALYESQPEATALAADLAAHVEIAAAIEAGDGPRAEEVTRGHLERALKLLFAAAD